MTTSEHTDTEGLPPLTICHLPPVAFFLLAFGLPALTWLARGDATIGAGLAGAAIFGQIIGVALHARWQRWRQRRN